MTTDRALKQLDRLVGTWTTESTHPAVSAVVHGTAVIEWLEGEQFLIHRARTDHPDFPDSISIIGFVDRDRVNNESDADAPAEAGLQLRMHYYDSRGVFRVYEAIIDDDEWRLWRNVPAFSQRFTGRFDEGGDTIAGLWQLCQDDRNWKDDLRITYRRRE